VGRRSTCGSKAAPAIAFRTARTPIGRLAGPPRAAVRPLQDPVLEAFRMLATMTKRNKLWTGTALTTALHGVSVVAFHAPRADASTKTPLTAQGASDPGFGAYLGACTTSADCSDGNTCESFRKRGNHCTHACQSAQECGSAGGRCTKLNRCGLVEPVKTEATDP
jgi:hypothetical protein